MGEAQYQARVEALRQSMTPTDEELIDKFLALRGKIEKLEEEHSKVMAPYMQAMKTIKGALQQRLNERGTESTKSTKGVCFKVYSERAKVIDRAEFFRFCFGNPDEAAHLLTSHIANDGVKDFVDRHAGQLPPGVESTATVDVTIRRS